MKTIITTGCDARFFPNLRILVGSWLSRMSQYTLVVCDFGLTEAQRRELSQIHNLRLLSIEKDISHPWLGKSLVGDFLQKLNLPWDILMWIDADALLAHEIPNLTSRITGYDILIDAHVQAVGEIAEAGNLEKLALNRDDAYFSAGWWIARKGCLLESYKRFSLMIMGQGNLWECDAFVAAIYHDKLKVRPLCGAIWHSRGKTSLHNCTVDGLNTSHAGHPIYVIHANAGYTTMPNGRRRLNRPELAAIQDHYESIYHSTVKLPEKSTQTKTTAA